MAWREEWSEKLYDMTGGILGSPTQAVEKELTDREKLIKKKQKQTAATQDFVIQQAKNQKAPGTRYQMTATEALMPGSEMLETSKYSPRTPQQIQAAEKRQSQIAGEFAEGLPKMMATGNVLMPVGAKVMQDLWEGGPVNRQVLAPAAATMVPEVPTEDIGKASLQDVAATAIETNTDEALKKERGLEVTSPAPAEVTYGKGDGVVTDKAGKETPASADDDAAQNKSASSKTAQNLENKKVKEDDDNKVGQGVLGDATQGWWFNVTDTLGDALINYGVTLAASGLDRGKAFAAAGQTFANGFDKYDRRQQIQDLRKRGYSDAEIINYINSGQISKPLTAGVAGKTKGLTEAQQKAKGGAARASYVNKTWGDKYGTIASTGDYPLATLGSKLRDVFTSEDSFTRGLVDLANPEYDKALRDEKGFLAGVLRPESGSAIGQMEWENYGHIYFPRKEDTTEDIARKAMLRDMTIKTLQSAGDPSDADAARLVDEITAYADKIIDYDPDAGAYILDNGYDYLVIE